MTALAASLAVTATLGAPAPDVLVQERFGASPRTAITYDTRSIPIGSRVVVLERREPDGGTSVALWLEGVQPLRTFGAHVHQKPCGPRPADSGPHYQHVKDPVQPSTDPAYANPRNEVWLDLTTDDRGEGGALSSVRWRFRPGEARSVVVHEHATQTHPGHAGTAGARLACVNVPFI
ncbi:superoxide dismutase family protein [Streptomyces sp. URMC 123]|uniref:superoxide dismutase family protein n=1 Tax=Streptomyces sp. URMC 123 TaxID=3423403 RepID=UPI003F1A7AC0